MQSLLPRYRHSRRNNKQHKNALKDNSWQNLCNNKEVTEVYDNTDTGVIEVNNDAWFVHLDWCIKNKTEDNK